MPVAIAVDRLIFLAQRRPEPPCSESLSFPADRPAGRPVPKIQDRKLTDRMTFLKTLGIPACLPPRLYTDVTIFFRIL